MKTDNKDEKKEHKYFCTFCSIGFFSDKSLFGVKCPGCGHCHTVVLDEPKIKVPKNPTPPKQSWEEELKDTIWCFHNTNGVCMTSQEEMLDELQPLISSLLTAKEREVLERTFGEMIKEAKNLPNLFSPEVLRDKYLKPEKVWHFVHNFAKSKGISLEDTKE